MFDSSNNRGGDRAGLLIVGGGTGGRMLGERLSEDSSVRVLLLEAGPDYAATRDVPEDLLDADQFPISHDWGYQSEPGVLGRSIPVPRAKVIGGSTAHNGAVAARGTPEDYDEWSRLGSPGWSFEQLLDDFRRLEGDPEGDVRYHGRGGPGADPPLHGTSHPSSHLVPPHGDRKRLSSGQVGEETARQ